MNTEELIEETDFILTLVNKGSRISNYLEKIKELLVDLNIDKEKDIY